MARANALLRRGRRGEQTIHRFGEFALDLSARRLTRNESEITLTPKEFALLARRFGGRVYDHSRVDLVGGSTIWAEC